MSYYDVTCIKFFRLIDVEEITNALKTLGEPIDDDDVAELIKLGEKDKNNKISLYGKQFCL